MTSIVTCIHADLIYSSLSWKTGRLGEAEGESVLSIIHRSRAKAEGLLELLLILVMFFLVSSYLVFMLCFCMCWSMVILFAVVLRFLFVSCVFLCFYVMVTSKILCLLSLTLLNVLLECVIHQTYYVLLSLFVSCFLMNDLLALPHYVLLKCST